MITAVVLAAGASTRFGRPKQLAVFRGESLVRRAARTALAAGVDRVVVVIPPDDAIRAELRDLDVTVVENPAAEEGIASSIRVGVAAANRTAVLLTLADQPLVTAEHLTRLVSAGTHIAGTTYEGTLGVPAFFSPDYLPELLALRGDRGARGVLEAHRQEAAAVPFDPAAADVDTEQQLRELL